MSPAMRAEVIILVVEDNVARDHSCFAQFAFTTIKQDQSVGFAPSPKHPARYLVFHSEELDLIPKFEGSNQLEVSNLLVFSVELHTRLNLTFLSYRCNKFCNVYVFLDLSVLFGC